MSQPVFVACSVGGVHPEKDVLLTLTATVFRLERQNHQVQRDCDLISVGKTATEPVGASEFPSVFN